MVFRISYCICIVNDNKFDFYNITDIADKKYKILDRALKHINSKKFFSQFINLHIS